LYDLNHDLIEYHDPAAVIVVDISCRTLIRSLYGLTRVATIPEKGVRLMEHFVDSKRPWVVCRHWTGNVRPPLTNADKEEMRQYIQRLKIKR